MSACKYMCVLVPEICCETTAGKRRMVKIDQETSPPTHGIVYVILLQSKELEPVFIPLHPCADSIQATVASSPWRGLQMSWSK